MSEFISWSTLGTYGGALAMVLVLTQFTKDLPFTKKLPTQIWSYILAFVVLILAHAFTTGLSIDIVAQTVFNAVIVSIAANGGFQAVQKLSHKDTDGELVIDTSGDLKDLYRFEVGDLDSLEKKKKVTLNIKKIA